MRRGCTPGLRGCMAVLSGKCVRNLPEQVGVDVHFAANEDRRLLRPVPLGVFRCRLSVFDQFSATRLRWLRQASFERPLACTGNMEAVSHRERNAERSWRQCRPEVAQSWRHPRHLSARPSCGRPVRGHGFACAYGGAGDVRPRRRGRHLDDQHLHALLCGFDSRNWQAG